jgi:hypothetical protein
VAKQGQTNHSNYLQYKRATKTNLSVKSSPGCTVWGDSLESEFFSNSIWKPKHAITITYIYFVTAVGSKSLPLPILDHIFIEIYYCKTQLVSKYPHHLEQTKKAPFKVCPVYPYVYPKRIAPSFTHHLSIRLARWLRYFADNHQQHLG